MKTEREFTGILTGFDDFVSELLASSWSSKFPLKSVTSIDMVLEDVTE